MTANLAIVGAGAIGKQHVDAAQATGAVVRYVIDTNGQRAQELAERRGAAWDTQVQTVWEDDAVDAVIIGVPNRDHMGLAVGSLAAGKDVLLEKPMAMNEGECVAINKVARANSRVLQIGFVHRYSSVAKVAQQIVADGRLGRVYHAKAHLFLRRGVPGLGGWFTTKELSGGGALIDVGVHLLDLALWLLGFPPVVDVVGQVYANFGRRMRNYVYEEMWAGPPNFEGVCDVEDSAHAFIRFDAGQTLDLQVAWAGNFPLQALPHSMIGCFGEEGGMTFELFGDRLQLMREAGDRLQDEQIPAPPSNMHEEQLADFLKAVQSRQVRGANGEQGQFVQSIVDRIYQSSQR